MAKKIMTLGDVVGNVLGEGHGDAVRAMVERMVQLVVELEVGKRYLSLVSLELLEGNPKEEPMMLVA